MKRLLLVLMELVTEVWAMTSVFAYGQLYDEQARNVLIRRVEKQEKHMEGLTEGRMCHYVAYNNRHLAAIVIGFEGINANLAVFTDMKNVTGHTTFGLQFHEGIPHSEAKEPGTWHWIEKA